MGDKESTKPGNEVIWRRPDRMPQDSCESLAIRNGLVAAFAGTGSILVVQEYVMATRIPNKLVRFSLPLLAGAIMGFSVGYDRLKICRSEREERAKLTKQAKETLHGASES